jgi:predicted ester cyclase
METKELTTYPRYYGGEPGDLSPNNVWQDVHAYFNELFTERQELPRLKLTEEQLVCDMQARFKKQYNAEMIAKLLKNGFEVKPGVYVFERRDFVRVTAGSGKGAEL